MIGISNLFAMVFLLQFYNLHSLKVEPINHVQNEAVGDLHGDLNEFLNLIPIDEIRNLTEQYYAKDASMRESYEYLRNEGSALLMETISKLTLVNKFYVFLNSTGINFSELVTQVKKIVLTSEEVKKIDVFEIDNDDDDDKYDGGSLGGINGFFKEALSLIPQDEVLTLFFVKMEESTAFSSFLEKITTSDYINLAESLKKSHGVQSIYFEFFSHGIDMMEWAKALKNFLGY